MRWRRATAQQTHTQKQAAYGTSKEQEQAHEKKEKDKDRRDEEMERTSGEGSEDRGRGGPEVAEGRTSKEQQHKSRAYRQARARSEGNRETDEDAKMVSGGEAETREGRVRRSKVKRSGTKRSGHAKKQEPNGSGSNKEEEDTKENSRNKRRSAPR